MATREEMRATLVKLQAEVDTLKKQIETVPSSSDWVKEFLKGKWVVRCANMIEAASFLTICKEAGITWCSGIAIDVEREKTRNDFHAYGKGIEYNAAYSMGRNTIIVNFTDVVPPAPNLDKEIADYVKANGSMKTAMSLGGGIPKAFLGYEESLPGPNPTRTFEEFMRGLFCVNCATQEEVKTFYTWCSHFGLIWGNDSKVTPYDDRTRNRFIMDRMPGDKKRMFYNAMPESPTVNFSDITPPIPPLPMFTFEAFLNREVCVNFRTEEERKIFWAWCKNADVNWKGKFTEAKWEMFRVNQRWVVSPSLYNDGRKRLCYDACSDVPEVQFTQIIPPVKPEPPKPTYTLEGFLNGEFCVNFDSNEERGILFDMIYARLDWSRFINAGDRNYLRNLYQNSQRWCVERNVRKGIKELFTVANKNDFPVEVKFKDMTLFSADIFGAGNVAVCFDGDNKKNDLLYFFAWCRKHGFRFQPSWEYILNSTFIWKVGYLVMEDGHLRQGGSFTDYVSSKYRRVNFSDIKPLLGEVVVHTMEDFKNRKFCIVYDKEDATEANHKLLSDWCEANGINTHFLFMTSGLNRFVVNKIGGAVLFHSAKDEVPAVNFNEIKHLLGGR